MARKNLPQSLELMFGHEGGYSSAKSDSGNFLNGVLVGTKYGITGKTLAAHRKVSSVTAAQVKSLTLEEATQIYVKSYWTQSGGDLLPSGLDYAAFDFGVNSGPARAVKTLQKVLGVAQDGIVGGQTTSAVDAYKGGIEKLIRDYCDARIAFMKGLGGSQGWATNGRGWHIRVTGIDPKGQYKKQAGVVGNALTMAKNDRGETAKEPEPVAVPSEIPEGKAPVSNTGLSTIASKPEAWGPLAGAASGILSNFTNSPILQGALAFGLVVGVLLGAFYFIKRMRQE